MRVASTVVLSLVLFACSCAPVATRASVTRSLEFGGEQIPYDVYVPAAQGQRPVLLVLHGARGRGGDMLQLWQEMADEQGIILVAPTLSLSAEQEARIPQLIPALMAEATRGLAFDPRRVYVFGYSAGGYFTYDIATLLSTRFAAAAVFAMVIAPEYASIVDRAQRKTPIAIYIGDHDSFWTVDQTRATRDLLVSRGFPVHYVEIANQGHGYAAIAQTINRDAWAFMSSATLP